MCVYKSMASMVFIDDVLPHDQVLRSAHAHDHYESVAVVDAPPTGAEAAKVDFEDENVVLDGLRSRAAWLTYDRGLRGHVVVQYRGVVAYSPADLVGEFQLVCNCCCALPPMFRSEGVAVVCRAGPGQSWLGPSSPVSMSTMSSTFTSRMAAACWSLRARSAALTSTLS